ncbi:MAG: hypothetical protein ACE5I1_31620 [bacterium]
MLAKLQIEISCTTISISSCASCPETRDAFGTCFAAENRYESLYENMKCGLLEECDRVMELFEKLGKSI